MPRQPVTRDRIGEVALAILDSAADESALTMRALATGLDVQAPSLYAHISGIDDVFALVHERINAAIDLTSLSDDDPLEGMRRFAHRYRDGYRRHLVAATVIITRSVNADHALAVYEPVAACLQRCGVPIDQVMPCMAMLDNLVLGSAIEPFAAAFVGRASDYRRDYPTLAEALRNSRRRRIDDEGFELGLDAFMGTVLRLARPAA
jgi:AcrR family transcriptional regulator